MASVQTLEVQSVMNEAPMNSRRWGVVVLCFTIALLDGFDTQSIAFIGPAIAEDFGMQAADMTWVITASTVGMAIGAMSLGSLGDKIGRKKAVMLALAFFGVFSLIAALATAPGQIVVLRFLIGLGMGGATPSLLALTAEYSPHKLRGTLMTVVLLGLPGGALIGGLVGAAWLPLVGWRGVFLIGGITPIVLLVLCVFLLPESPGFLAATGKPDANAKACRLLERMTGRTIPQDTVLRTEVSTKTAKRGSVKSLLSLEYRRTTIGIWAVYLFNWTAWFLLLLWLPTALTTQGLAKSTAALGTVTVNGAFILMAIPLSTFLPKLDPRGLLLAMFASGVAIAILLGFSGTNWTLVFILIAAAGFGIGGQQLVLNYLIAEAYPTQLRSTATGWSIGIGRLGSIIGSALGGVLLTGLGVSGYFMSLAVPLALAAVATLIVRHHKGGYEPSLTVEATPDPQLESR